MRSAGQQNAQLKSSPLGVTIPNTLTGERGIVRPLAIW